MDLPVWKERLDIKHSYLSLLPLPFLLGTANYYRRYARSFDFLLCPVDGRLPVVVNDVFERISVEEYSTTIMPAFFTVSSSTI
jgi:hypothetical protein